MTFAVAPSRSSDNSLVDTAVRRSRALSGSGVLERAFALAFRNLVYAQIWEDPVVDLEALDIRFDSRIVAIASGGCNIVSYLTANPAEVFAVDLNAAHVALNRLKLVAAQNLPDYDAFYRFFGHAADARNIKAFHQYVAPNLDAQSLRYWSDGDWLGRPRITTFARNVYRTGLLGRFIGTAHIVARLFGVNPKEIIRSTSRKEQIEFFETRLAPLFDRWLIKRMLDNPMSLYGLGIPPAQYQELVADAPRMADVVRERLRKLTCDHDLSHNYFAWQAFNRGYAENGQGPLPPYLQAEHFEAIRQRAHRVSVTQTSFTEFLVSQPARSLDRYVLLDAQDWMSDRQLRQLWRAITRTARPDARVIFRTAAETTILAGKLPIEITRHWSYHERRSRELHGQDRSAIYGGFHLYTRVD